MLMSRFLLWFGETFASRKKLIIQDPCGAGPYLTRYYMLGHRKSKYALMLHHIHRSDQDRDLHDHPWAFWSLILTGWYWEVTTSDNSLPWIPVTEYRAGSLLRRPALWKHRLVLLWPMWTLVLRFQYERKWGFHTKDGWVPFDKYDYEAGCE